MSSQGAVGVLRRELVTAFAMCFQYSSGSIVRLLEPRRPAAILRRVRAVVVDTIKGIIRRGSRAHIGEKRFETDQPARAYPDATPSVTMPLGVRRIFAAIKHMSPRRIFRATSPTPVAVGNRAFLEVVVMEAAAASGMATPEVLRRNRCPATAVAGTDPVGSVAPVWATHVDDESTNPHPSHVYRSHARNLTSDDDR